MRVIVVLTIVCAFALTVFSQNGANSFIRGKVTDKDGNPVEAAEITVVSPVYPDKPYTGISDEEGKFSFNVPRGKNTVKASKTQDGVELVSELVEANFTWDTATEVNLILLETGGIREKVDIQIATGTSQPFSAVSKTVTVIDSTQIRDRNENSVVDSLRTVPGFRIQQLGGAGKTANIKTRGLRNQDTAILIDGQRFRDPSSITGDASAFLSDLSTVNVERIEVLRGSGSSVYGTNAIGGVIDIQTPRPANGFTGNLNAQYGGLGFSRFSGDSGFGTKDGRFGFTVGASRFAVTKGIDGEDDANNTSFRGRIDANPFERLTVSGRVFLSDAFVRLNTGPDTLGTILGNGIIDARSGVNFVSDLNDPDNFQRSDFFSGQVSANYVINSRAVFSTSYQGLRTKRENENGGLGPGFQPFGGTQFSYFDGQVHTLNSKLDWTPSKAGRIIAGYEFELEKYGNEGIGGSAADAFATTVNQNSHTFFAQYLASALDKRLQFAGGFRAQTFALSTPVFGISNAPYSAVGLETPPAAITFDGAVSYFISSTDTKIRAHAGNGYRVPSLYERFGSFYSSFSQSFTALGDPNLMPERSIAFDAGIDQSFYRDRVNLSLTYFYTRLTDTIGYGNVVPDIGSTSRPFGGYQNTKGGLARGMEFSASTRLSRLTDAFVSYTFTKSDQRSPQVSGSGVIKTLGVPDHQFTFNATQRIARHVTLNFDFESTADYLAPIFSNTSFSTYIYRFSGNRKGDLTASYKLPVFGEKAKASVFATVENVFGYTYFENGFATAGRTARVGVGLEF